MGVGVPTIARLLRRKPAAAVALVLLLAGCRSSTSMLVDGAYQPDPPAHMEFGEFSQTPRPRLGGLPWPGALTLFEAISPGDLGQHSYGGPLGNSERSRGMIYTCRGGFIDIAHTRKSIDLCKYAAVRAEFALRRDWTAFRLKSIEPSLYTVRLNYPPYWRSLPPEKKDALVRELSIRIGQRMSMLMMTWHEAMTWFGYSSTPISESQSAFTYDDTGSHALGMLVGGRALRDHTSPWNEAVTRELAGALSELGAADPEQTVEAGNSVEDESWRGLKPLQRQFEWGWEGEPIVAQIVPRLAFCDGAVPYRYELPRLDFVLGRDVRGLVQVEIEPRVLQAGRIRAVVPGAPSVIEVDRDMPLIMRHMKRQHLDQDGVQRLRP